MFLIKKKAKTKTKTKTKRTNQTHTFKNYENSYNVKILNSFKQEQQVKNTELVFKKEIKS